MVKTAASIPPPPPPRQPSPPPPRQPPPRNTTATVVILHDTSSALKTKKTPPTHLLAVLLVFRKVVVYVEYTPSPLGQHEASAGRLQQHSSSARTTTHALTLALCCETALYLLCNSVPQTSGGVYRNERERLPQKGSTSIQTIVKSRVFRRPSMPQ